MVYQNYPIVNALYKPMIKIAINITQNKRAKSLFTLSY